MFAGLFSLLKGGLNNFFSWIQVAGLQTEQFGHKTKIRKNLVACVNILLFWGKMRNNKIWNICIRQVPPFIYIHIIDLFLLITPYGKKIISFKWNLWKMGNKKKVYILKSGVKFNILSYYPTNQINFLWFYLLFLLVKFEASWLLNNCFYGYCISFL